MLALATLLLILGLASAEESKWEMRVCADPNSLPFSNKQEMGFENRIAEILSETLNAQLTYLWWPQGPTMISNQLREGNCDIIMGIPDGYGELLSTVAYYRSPHVFVYREDSPFEISSLDDPALASLSIGVQRTGTAPHEALLKRGLADNVVLQSGDRGYGDDPDPLARVIREVAGGTIDVGLVWGPIAGYYAAESPIDLAVVPVTPEIDPPFLSMVTPITIGVRPGDEALRDRLNRALAESWDEIQEVLQEYEVPLSPLPQPTLLQEEAPPNEPTAIGVVIPTQTGTGTVGTSTYDIVGEAARMGALLAEDDVAMREGDAGADLELLMASSPSPEAAIRAAERLLATENVTALIGGIGDGQAEVLSALAEEHGVPFLNIGSPSLALRDACKRFTFHVEASAAMYLDALVEWHASQDHERWFIVYAESTEGESLYQQALQSIAEHAADSVVVGAAAVQPGQPYYGEQLEQARMAEPDVLLFLAPAVDQIPFLSQYTQYGPPAPVAAFPDPVAQTRDFIAAEQFTTRNPWHKFRILLWETTLSDSGAGDLNERFIARWGKPMDPTAWSAYAAVQIFHQALGGLGTLSGPALVEYLKDPKTTFDLRKGPALSFRPWDHQLRQPLYVTQSNPEAEWGTNVSQRIAVASLVAPVPDVAQAEDHAEEALDLLGQGKSDLAGCR